MAEGDPTCRVSRPGLVGSFIIGGQAKTNKVVEARGQLKGGLRIRGAGQDYRARRTERCSKRGGRRGAGVSRREADLGIDEEMPNKGGRNAIDRLNSNRRELFG